MYLDLNHESAFQCIKGLKNFFITVNKSSTILKGEKIGSIH